MTHTSCPLCAIALTRKVTKRQSETDRDRALSYYAVMSSWKAVTRHFRDEDSILGQIYEKQILIIKILHNNAKIGH